MKADTRGFVIFTTVGCIAAGGVGYAVWQSTSPEAQKVSDKSSIPSTTSSSSTKTTSSSSDMPAPPTAVASPLVGDPLLPPNAFVPRDTPEVAPTKLYRPQAQASRNYGEPNPLNNPGAPDAPQGGTAPRNNNPGNNSPANPARPDTGGANTNRRPNTQERGENNVAPAPSLAWPSTSARPAPGSDNDTFIEEEGPSAETAGTGASSREPSAIPSRPQPPNGLPGQHLPSYPSPQGGGQQSGQSPATASNTPSGNTTSGLASGGHTSTGQPKTNEFNGMGGPDVPIDASGIPGSVSGSGTESTAAAEPTTTSNASGASTQSEQPTQQGSADTQSQQSEQAPSAYNPANETATDGNTTTVYGQDSMPNTTSFSTTYSAEPTEE